MLARPAKPFLVSKKAEHGETLRHLWLTYNLGSGKKKKMDARFKRTVWEGIEIFATIDAVFLEILRKDWRGGQKVVPHQGVG